jgi:hypothetical protein
MNTQSVEATVTGNTKPVFVDFQKHCYLGDRYYVAIQFKNGNLSITGVEKPLDNGDCDSCGQIVMHAWSIKCYSAGWDLETITRLREIWNAWHLNDLCAGSPAQRAYLEAHPIDVSHRPDHYSEACRVLAAAGLHPDPGYLHEGKPYAYGHAWLRKEVPTDVIAWLVALPASTAGLPDCWQRF